MDEKSKDSNIKTVKCSVSDKAFKAEKSLKIHMTNFHEKIVYKIVSISNKDLEDHKIKDHGNNKAGACLVEVGDQEVDDVTMDEIPEVF